MRIGAAAGLDAGGVGHPRARATESGSRDDNSAGPDSDLPPEAAAQTPAKRRDKEGRQKPHAARYWSPHDPDASFGYKGLGYHVHIAETCRNGRTELLTDYAVLTAAQSDSGRSTPALQRLGERGMAPVPATTVGIRFRSYRHSYHRVYHSRPSSVSIQHI